MKIFNRTSLPEQIKYNGEIYALNTTISAGMNQSSTPPAKVIEALRSTGKKGILVNVLSRNLKGVRDLHGKEYPPSKWIFTN